MIKPTPKTKKKEEMGLGRLITSISGNGTPITRTVFLNVRDEDDIFLRRPRTLLHPYFVTARWPSHSIRYIYNTLRERWMLVHRAALCIYY